MATYFARKAGNINDVDIWATTPAGTAADYFPSFTASDILVCNGFVVEINVSVTVAQLIRGVFEGSSGTGNFNLAASGLTITAAILNSGTTSGTILCTAASYTLTITGALTSSNSGPVINWTGASGTLTVNGAINANGGGNCISFGSSNGSTTINGNVISTSLAAGLITAASGVTVLITGNVLAGTTGEGVYLNGANQTVTINGNVTAGSSTSGVGLYFSAASSTSSAITINGNVTGGSGGSSYGVQLTDSCTNTTVSITGNIAAGPVGAGAILQHLSGATTITGNITANTVGQANIDGLVFSGGGALTITGDVKGGTNITARGLEVTLAGGDVNIIGDIIGGDGATGGPGVYCDGARACYIGNIEYGNLGASPTYGTVRFTDSVNNTAKLYRYLDTHKTLVDAAAVVSADPADVRAGTSYDNGTQTGTCSVPAANTVLLGTPVDATTGTLFLTEDITDRLANCATVASVGQQLADALSGV